MKRSLCDDFIYAKNELGNEVKHMEHSLKNFYLTRGGENTIDKFVESVVEGIKGWVNSDSLVVIGILPDGAFYAMPLVERLREDGRDVKYAEIDTNLIRLPKCEIKLKDMKGNDFKESQLENTKLLIVRSILTPDETYEKIMAVLGQKNIQSEDIKFAVFEDRTGLADFRYRITPDVLIREQFFESAKESLQKLEPVKKKLLLAWKEVPKDYQSEMLAVLMSHTREWREWERQGEISADILMDWLQESLTQVAYAYPDISIPSSFKKADVVYINKNKGVL
jgi:pyrimidine operon attenuation protein/uracil phosphoribosyltransferase